MSWWSDPSGATKAKARSWIGLSERADIVVRFQGGHNAGHTLCDRRVSYKLSLLPSGVRSARQARRHRQWPWVIDPHALLAENRQACGPGRQGHAREPAHRRQCHAHSLAAPRARRHTRGRGFNSGTKIGTTRRGIGPAYQGQGRPPRDPRHGSRRSRHAAGKWSIGC